MFIQRVMKVNENDVMETRFHVGKAYTNINRSLRKKKIYMEKFILD